MKTKNIDLRIYGPISINPGDEFNEIAFSLNKEEAIMMMWNLYLHFEEIKGEEFDKAFDEKIKQIYSAD